MAGTGEILTEKAESGVGSDSTALLTAVLKAQSDSQASAAAAALSQDLHPKNADLSFWEKAQVVAGAAVEGTVTNGLDQITQHPLQAAGKMAGAVALGVAMQGPAWAKIPALAFSAVGTVAYAKHLADAGNATADILGNMNRSNLDESKSALAAQLGPVIFDTALMSAGGFASSKLAATLPAEFSQLKIASSLSLARDHVANVLGGDFGGMTPALAGAGNGFGSRSFKFETIMPERAPAAQDNIMAMATHGTAGGSRVTGDGLRVTSGRGMQGETFTNIDNITPGNSVNITHENGAVTAIGSDGKILVGFNSGEGRTVHLGTDISRVTVSDFANGVKQFRFNNKLVADLEVDPQNHSIKAALGNGDHMHMLDNFKDGHMYFTHRDQLQTWVEHSGRVVIQTPEGKVHEVRLSDNLSFIRMLEKPDGSKEFRFLNDSGIPLQQIVKIPPTESLAGKDRVDLFANATRERPRQSDDDINPQLRAYIAAKQQARANLHASTLDNTPYGGGGVGTGSPSSSDGTMFPHHTTSHTATGFGIMPSSFERAVAREITGVPYGIMRGNDLSAPADMELAMQGHSWVVTNYLDHLGYQEPAYHDHW